MGLQNIWKNYKVVIVMGTSLVLIHLGWYNLRSLAPPRTAREEYIPVPGIVAYVSPPAAPSPPPPPPASATSK